MSSGLPGLIHGHPKGLPDTEKTRDETMRRASRIDPPRRDGLGGGDTGGGATHAVCSMWRCGQGHHPAGVRQRVRPALAEPAAGRCRRELRRGGGRGGGKPSLGRPVGPDRNAEESAVLRICSPEAILPPSSRASGNRETRKGLFPQGHVIYRVWFCSVLIPATLPGVCLSFLFISSIQFNSFFLFSRIFRI